MGQRNDLSMGYSHDSNLMFNPFKRRVQPTQNIQSMPRVQHQNQNEKCRIRIKKMADGSMVKEISGNCTPTQLKALSEVNENELTNE